MDIAAGHESGLQHILNGGLNHRNIKINNFPLKARDKITCPLKTRLRNVDEIFPHLRLQR